MGTEFYSYCTEVLSKIRKNSTFVTVSHYTNNEGQVADYSICFHIDYIKAVRTSKDLLEKYQPVAKDIQMVGTTPRFSLDDLVQARQELIASYQMSLTGNNPLATSAHAYQEIKGQDEELIPGVKLHTSQDLLHLWGFCIHRRVILPGREKEDRRGPKTVAKDMLRKMVPLGRFSQFKLSPGKFEKLVVERITIREEDVIRKTSSSLYNNYNKVG